MTSDGGAKVLVTGCTGFIGSAILPVLVEKGYDVYAWERYVTGRFVLGQTRNIKTIFGDLRENGTVKRALREIQPDVVIHLAAISPVAYSYDHPNEVMETNLVGTINLAQACLDEVPHFEQFLFASTSETYGNGAAPKTEDTPQHPNSPYSVSKVACEKFLLYLRDAYQFPITILRPFNTYGRKNNTHFVVEKAIVQMLTDGGVRLGDPTAMRDFLYVDDHVDAYLKCLGNPRALGEVFNFCTGRGVSIAQLIELLRGLTGFQGDVVWNTIPARPLDIKVLVGDSGRARDKLGWTPRFKLEEGLQRTVEYWRSRLGALYQEQRSS
ncbi:MAG: SDR family NAD(P)-dependent oxidoreductase [Conexivisphaerales archaeon]|jgi:nucleoside-diphosphate-sugar epimerase